MDQHQQEQFYQMMTRLKANSRAASTKDDAIITEIVDGLIVSNQAKKIEYIGEARVKNESEPIVIDLQKSNAGSVQGINKLREIQDFINGRRF